MSEKHFEPGDKVMWNSSKFGWVPVTVIRKSKSSNSYWLVRVDSDGRQEQILPQRMVLHPEWALLNAINPSGGL